MRLGILAPNLTNTTGWGNHSLNILRALSALGIEMVILAAANSPLPADLPIHPILPAITPQARGFLARCAALVPQARGLLAACTHVHALVEPYAPLAALLSGKRPLFITGHGTYVNLPLMRRPPIGALYRAALRRGTLVAVSAYTAQAAQRATPGLRTTIVPNAIDAARFAQLPPMPDRPTGRLILSNGGIKRRKGTLELVEAIAAIRPHAPDVQLVCLGRVYEADYAAQVQAYIEAQQLADNVALAGFVSEERLRQYYGAADIFALPSINAGYHFEGFGLVHLEASAAGLPVIGTEGCGVADAVQHEVTGLLLPQDQLRATLPAALLRLLEDAPLRARMGAAGRAYAQTQTWEHSARLLLAAYAHNSGGPTHR